MESGSRLLQEVTWCTEISDKGLVQGSFQNTIHIKPVLVGNAISTPIT